MSITLPVPDSKPKLQAHGVPVQSNEDRLIIPYVMNKFELPFFPEEKIGKRMTKEKLQKLLSELDHQIDQKNAESRRKWRFFVFLMVLIIITVITFIVLVLSYGGAQTELPAVETGKKSIASFFVILTIISGIGWLYTGARGAREQARLSGLLDDINKRRGVKKNNLFIKFGHHMKWLELHYDYRKYKMDEEKRIKDMEDMISGNIKKKSKDRKKSKIGSDSPSSAKRKFEFDADEPSPPKGDGLNDSSALDLVPIKRKVVYGKLNESGLDTSLNASLGRGGSNDLDYTKPPVKAKQL